VQNEVVAQYESQRHDTETVLNLRESELQDQRNRIDELKRVFTALEENLALRCVALLLLLALQQCRSSAVHYSSVCTCSVSHDAGRASSCDATHV
jgi:uncharacterized protein YigA (DUF484 family)